MCVLSLRLRVLASPDVCEGRVPASRVLVEPKAQFPAVGGHQERPGLTCSCARLSGSSGASTSSPATLLGVLLLSAAVSLAEKTSHLGAVDGGRGAQPLLGQHHLQQPLHLLELERACSVFACAGCVGLGDPAEVFAYECNSFLLLDVVADPVVVVVQLHQHVAAQVVRPQGRVDHGEIQQGIDDVFHGCQRRPVVVSGRVNTVRFTEPGHLHRVPGHVDVVLVEDFQLRQQSAVMESK